MVEDGRQVRVFFQTVEIGFIHCFCYPMVEIAASRYSDACQISNYLNCRTNFASVQVFPEDNSLVLRTKSSSSISQGGADEDFNNVAYAAALMAYENWHLFEALSSTDLSAETILERATHDSDGDL